MTHAISTKPYLDVSFAQILYDAGSSVNYCNRYGATAAHEMVTLRQFDFETRQRAAEALQWLIAHGGDISIKDGDSMSPKFVIGRLSSMAPELAAVVNHANPSLNSSTASKKVGRSDPCSRGSKKKFKVCCAKH